MQIKVEEIRKSRFPAALAEAQVLIELDEGHSVRIDDLRIIESRHDGRRRVHLPDIRIYGQDRTVRYLLPVRLDEGLFSLLQEAVLAAYDRQSIEGQQ